ncbi:ASCH domain-containing protein [Streptococcus salivarius]
MSVILESKGSSVCIIETTKVVVLPFKQVSVDHACKEDEGNQSLTYC